MSGYTKGPWPEPEYENDCGYDGGFSEWWSISNVANFYEQEDAEFAWLACNSHQALLDCLKEARKHLDNADIDLAYIDEVIAKAEGRT